MIDERVDTDLELIFSEEADEVKCESTHNKWDNPICTEEVTHRLASCERELNACFASYHAYSVLAIRGTTCIGCDNPAIECWTFQPI